MMEDGSGTLYGITLLCLRHVTSLIRKNYPNVSSFPDFPWCLLMHYRRKAFWVAKQVLQLGMGDAFDDWLIEKIQLLRRGTVVASAIKRIEQVIFDDLL